MDYNVSPSVFNVTISAGAISSTFNIDINDDEIHEDNETFNIAIKLVPTALQLTLCISSTTVTIIDHDGMLVNYLMHFIKNVCSYVVHMSNLFSFKNLCTDLKCSNGILQVSNVLADFMSHQNVAKMDM